MTVQSLPKRVRISLEVVFREMSVGAVLVDLDGERHYGLDEVGTRMFQLLDKHGDVLEVIAILLSEYDIEEMQLRADLAGLIQKLVEFRLADVEA